MDYYPDREKETARNILRRAEITRLTQNLKSRLALATFKTQRGLQNVGLDSIERYQEQQRQQETANRQRSAKRSEPGPQISAPKREYDGLQQGFAPSPGAAMNRKRARTLDATGPAIISQPTSMPAPSRIPASHSVPSHMNEGNMHHLQPPAMLKSSPDRSEADGPMMNNTNEPQTPPPPQRKNGNRSNNERDDANLLLFLATSPGRGPMSPRTPGRDINFNDYLNLFTPSPQVNRQVSLTNIDSARQRLTFE